MTPDAYLDPDVYAARQLVRELSGNPHAELLAGISSTQFCPIAVSLAEYAPAMTDLDYDELCEEPEKYADLVGGSSYLWQVELSHVLYPAIDDYCIDLVNDDYTDDEIETLLNSEEWDLDSSDGEMLRRRYLISDDASGPGAGTPAGFIRRFDAGEWPWLHLDTP